MLENTWKDYFSFAKHDRYGILYALFLFVFLIFVPKTYQLVIYKNDMAFVADTQKNIKKYRSQILAQKGKNGEQTSSKYIQYSGYKQSDNFAKKNMPIAKLTAFNPNELTKEKAMSLGLSQKVGSNIENYLKKGGKFRKTADFKKIYGMSDADYERLKPYIVLPNQNDNQKSKKNKHHYNEPSNEVAAELFKFNPNELTKEKAMSLGLSQKVGSNIENYLKKGGKFRKTADFKKIYGMSDADYERLKPYIILPKKSFNKKKEKYESEKSNNVAIQLSEFNPNELTKEKAMSLGLSQKVGSNIENYLKKGGKFFKTADFKKIYGMSDADYERLKPYIKLEEEKRIASPKPSYKTDWENFKIDMNKADIEEWKKLRGIGESFSARIVKYRTDLGGFVSKEQLKEVYGLDADLYAKIAPHLLPIEAETVQPKLNINAATAEMLWKHPYLTPTIAKGIVQYRKRHGKFKKIEELKKLYLIDEELYEKIVPYFRID